MGLNLSINSIAFSSRCQRDVDKMHFELGRGFLRLLRLSSKGDQGEQIIAAFF